MDRHTCMTVFAKSVELGSFAAAAEALSMSPQLVGKHVRQLEQHLGVRLLNRTTRRQSLTDVGRVYYERTHEILAEITAAEDLVSETRAAPRGRLRINAPITFGIHALTPRLPDYLRLYPEVSIDLSLSNRYVDLIDEGYDVAFRVGALADSSLIARPLHPYRLVLCAAPSYLEAHAPILTPMDLRSHACLGYTYGSLAREWSFDGPTGCSVVPVTCRMAADSGEALLALALAGMGLLLQPIEMLETPLREGRLRTVLPDHTCSPRPFHLLFAPDRRPTPKLRTFIDFAVAAFGRGRSDESI